MEEIKDAGFNDIFGEFIRVDDSYESLFEVLPKVEVDEILNSFNSLFKTNLKYQDSEAGLISILFERFGDYEDYKRDYFATFFLKIFAFEINILASEAKTKNIKGLSDFVSRFAPEDFKTYQEISKKLNFTNIITCRG